MGEKLRWGSALENLYTDCYNSRNDLATLLKRSCLMDTLSFIAALVASFVALVGACAWPLAITIFFLLFREPISQVVLGLRELELPGVKAKLGERIQEIKEKAEEIQPAQLEANIPDYEQAESLAALSDAKEVAAISPNAAISLAWSVVEQEIARTVHDLRLDIPTHRYVTPRNAARVLHRHGLIGPAMVDLLDEMQAVRNGVAHMQMDIASEDATAFISAAKRVIAKMISLRASYLDEPTPTG